MENSVEKGSEQEASSGPQLRLVSRIDRYLQHAVEKWNRAERD